MAPSNPFAGQNINTLAAVYVTTVRALERGQPAMSDEERIRASELADMIDRAARITHGDLPWCEAREVAWERVRSRP